MDEALADNQIIIGWTEAQNLLNPSLTKDDFRRIIGQGYPEKSAHWVGKAMGHMWRFVREMSEGDLVLVPRHNEIYIAEITGGPTYDPKLREDDTSYRRKVRWFHSGKPLEKETLDAGIIAEINKLRSTSVEVTSLLERIANAAGAEVSGEDWTPAELEAAVTDYREMLLKELAGQPYNKSEYRRALIDKVMRSNGSIEFKLQNISAVLEEVGSPWIKGYKPRHNYQDALADVVGRIIISAEQDALLPPPAPKRAIDPAKVFVPPPSLEDEQRKPKSAVTKGLARKIDQAGRDARNRALGQDGEEFVVELEKQKLTKFPRLAEKVVNHAREKGDGLGYDVYSFDEKGNELFIEVKTTRGGITTPFYVSQNELDAAADLGSGYRLYRVYEFDDPKAFILEAPLADKLDLNIATYRAAPRTSSTDPSKFRYFAYGSNMSTKRLRARTPGSTSAGLAVLPRHQLRFHEKSKDGSAKCDAFFTGSLADAVIGVVFDIPIKEKSELDRAEGLGVGYDEKEVELLLSDGRTAKAVVYIASPTAIDDKLEPFDWYHAYVLVGAQEHGLPDDYIDANIRNVRTKSDKRKV